MYTFIFGWLLFFWHYMGPEHYLIDQTSGVMSGRAMWILYGALLGSIMWFNVWFVIWPRQKQDGPPSSPSRQPCWPRRTSPS